MSPLALGLVLLAAVCLVLAIGYQLDAYEARYEARLRDLAEQWEANQRGSAKVVDFQEYLKQKHGKEAA